jgi:hypothetical protein
LFATEDQPRIAQDKQVFGYSRRRQLKQFDELAYTEFIPAIQSHQDADTVFVAKRFGDIHEMKHNASYFAN